jgi:hypothetical protein
MVEYRQKERIRIMRLSEIVKDKGAKFQFCDDVKSCSIVPIYIVTSEDSIVNLYTGDIAIPSSLPSLLKSEITVKASYILTNEL